MSADEGFQLRSWASFSNRDSFEAEYDLAALGLEGHVRTRTSSGFEWVFTGGVTGTYVDLHETFAFKYSRSDAVDAVGNLGAQFTAPLVEDKLELTFALTGQYETMGNNFELTPSIRMLFKPTERDRFWMSFTRSTRPLNLGTAYNSDVYGQFADLNPPVLSIDRWQLVLMDNDSIESEEIQAFEAGYRRSFGEKGEFGITFFYNEYNDLLGFSHAGLAFRQFGVPGATPYVEVQAQRDNIADATTYGFDTHIRWAFTPRVSATLTYSYLNDSYSQLYESSDPGEANLNRAYFDVLANGSPKHLASLWIAADLNEAWRADLGLRYSHSFGREDAWQKSIFQMDARLSWAYSDALNISLVGRNLLDSRTDETNFPDYTGLGTEQRREWYLEVSYVF